jgi:TRAP transporter TAXI family solute receptor
MVSTRRPEGKRGRGYMVVLAPTLLILLLVVGAFVLRPGAPRHVVIATGGGNSTFFKYGQAYQRLLAGQGITLEVQETGASENVAQLESPKSDVQMAIIHGGTLETEAGDGVQEPDEIEKRHPNLVALGTVFCEPIWIFHRLPGEPDRLSALLGKRVAIGRPKLVSNVLARLLLRTAGIDSKSLSLVEMKGSDAVAALAKGEIDAVILSAPPEARPVQELRKIPGAKLMSLAQAEAFVRHLPWLNQVTLPAGGLDIATNSPPADVKMLASGANLVARRSLHSGLVYLLLAAATRVHGGAGAFQRYGEFPSLSYVDLPVHEGAQKYFKEGPPLLYRYLPFWLAAILERIGVVLPIAALVLSIARYAPPLYAWFMMNRINRSYGELRYLEDEIGRMPAGDADDLARRLSDIEARVTRFSAPVSYSPRLYDLRAHIQLVRAKLQASQSQGSGSAPRSAAAGGEGRH